MNPKNPTGPRGYRSPKVRRRGRRLHPSEIPNPRRQGKLKYRRGYDLVILDLDHTGRRLGVRSRRKGLSGRQWVRLRKSVGRARAKREAEQAEQFAASGRLTPQSTMEVL